MAPTDVNAHKLREYERHRERAFDYEVRAIDFANSAFRALTYLNGGALVAIPTAVALFQTDIKQGPILLGAVLFVLGLVFVAAAQGCGFFTMARRSESEIYLQSSNIDDAKAKFDRSNLWRGAAILLYLLSLACFVGGCSIAAWAIMAVNFPG